MLCVSSWNSYSFSVSRTYNWFPGQLEAIPAWEDRMSDLVAVQPSVEISGARTRWYKCVWGGGAGGSGHLHVTGQKKRKKKEAPCGLR